MNIFDLGINIFNKDVKIWLLWLIGIVVFIFLFKICDVVKRKKIYFEKKDLYLFSLFFWPITLIVFLILCFLYVPGVETQKNKIL
ncbi:hypothetical protein KKA23_02645 [Patescibacteria group bacterium]|nr:hypothetical protein [Patescibacteria group bacterium]MBU3922832.1 hypothetical protein [Patescibacteria group bacterium]